MDLLVGVFIIMCSAFTSLFLSLAGGVMCRMVFSTQNQLQRLLGDVALISLALLVLCIVAFGLILFW